MLYRLSVILSLTFVFICGCGDSKPTQSPPAPNVEQGPDSGDKGKQGPDAGTKGRIGKPVPKTPTPLPPPPK
ncbi:hypothetical protein FTUN_3407 [Frigoriglobus tundricola]|uniref:Uncharacterized protein n=1 Tax=Frigoriglobus tundricola TaxID=2774151 RepID=A0A6M5YRD5_9BACT|nr:hypothetical protein FTUN_3407 [Frigoriglobus tundricola]